MLENVVAYCSGASACVAPLIGKIDIQSSRENLVMTSPFEILKSVQILGEGRGRLNVTCDFGCSQLIRFICLLRSLSHPNQDWLAVVTRMVLSSKIKGLNYRPPLLGFP